MNYSNYQLATLDKLDPDYHASEDDPFFGDTSVEDDYLELISKQEGETNVNIN